MDYILLGIHCSKLGYRNLRFAAGDNLTTLPYIGRKFGSLGAFPIYRDRVTSRKYVLGLCEQVAAMIDDGDNVIAFPEGGRSYGGAMLKMKTGLIAANIIAQCRSRQTQHYFLPITVSYEVLPEVSYLSWLKTAKRLRSDTHRWARRAAGSILYYGADLLAFAGLMLARSGGHCGNVYLDYAEPFPVDSVIDVGMSYAPDARNALIAHKSAAKQVADEIRRQLERLYRILAMHVVAYELTNGHTCRADITARIPATIGLLEAQGRNCKSLNVLSAKEVLEQGTAQLSHLNAVAVHGGDLTPTKLGIVNYCAQAIGPTDLGR